MNLSLTLSMNLLSLPQDITKDNKYQRLYRHVVRKSKRNYVGVIKRITNDEEPKMLN